MKNNLKYGCSLIRALSIVIGLMAGSVSQGFAKDSNPSIIPPDDKVYGMTYGEWSARWWQWNLSLPVDQNPSFDGSVSEPPNPLEDRRGECSNGTNGQLGPVWFLTGVINNSGNAERHCQVPAGKALFFPVINVECSTLEKNHSPLESPFYGRNEKQLRACVEKFNYENVYVDIDGVRVLNLTPYLIESPLFNFTVPANNVLGVAPDTGQSVSKGYYLMLAPLSAGNHEIHFGGTYPNFNYFTLNIIYKLTVVSEEKP